jgi:AMMECR1 domain-containing protein
MVALAQRNRAWMVAHRHYACCCDPSGHTHHVGYGLVTWSDRDRRWSVPLSRLPRLVVERHLFAFGRVATLAAVRAAVSRYRLDASTVPRTDRGVFVTLNTGGRLRGCVGTFALATPTHLAATVAEYTWRAAREDNRFAPLCAPECFALDYHITLLRAPETVWERTEHTVGDHAAFVAVRAKVVVGTHGVTLTFDDGRQATFLASVFPDHFGCNAVVTRSQWREVVVALRDKCGSAAKVVTVARYVCEGAGEG